MMRSLITYLKIRKGVLKLNDQCEKHLYVEKFTKKFNVLFIFGTYILEGEADVKFSLGDIWKLFQE